MNKFLFLILSFLVFFIFQSHAFSEQEKPNIPGSDQTTQKKTIQVDATPVEQEQLEQDQLEQKKAEDKQSEQKEALQKLQKQVAVQQKELTEELNRVDIAKKLAQQEFDKQKNLLNKESNLIVEKQSLFDHYKNLSEQKLTQTEQLLMVEKSKLTVEKSKIDQKQLQLTRQAENLLEQQHLTDQKLLKIEQHWLNQIKGVFDNSVANIQSIHLIVIVIFIFFLYVLFIVKKKPSRLKEKKAEKDHNDKRTIEKSDVSSKLIIDSRRVPAQTATPIVDSRRAPNKKNGYILDSRGSDRNKIASSNSVANKPLIWLSVITFPLLAYFYLIHSGVNNEVAIFTGIVVMTLLMWMSSLMQEFVPALLALLLVLLFELAPKEVVLSGFSSPGFLLLFSVMGLGAVITSSGLTRRYTLWLIKSIPSNLFANQVALFFTGLVFNPIVPTINGRAMIVAPILHNIISGWDKQTKEKSSTSLYTSGLDGINFLSPIFLTAAPANLVIYGLLPAQERQAFDFMFWIYASSIVGLVMFFLYFILTAVYFRSFQTVKIEKKDVINELEKLGSLKWAEWVGLGGIILMAIGIATSSMHKVSIPLVTLAVLCTVLVMGVLSREQFIQRIDWSFLVMLASLIGVLGTMSVLGIDQSLIKEFSWLGDYMRNDFQMFVLMLTGMILLVRIFIPLNSAIFIFAAALLPMATGAGVSAWVIGFIILMMCGTAFFGYQSPYILYFQSLLKGDVPYVDLKFQIFQILLVLVKLVAIYASIPFWTKIGVL